MLLWPSRAYNNHSIVSSCLCSKLLHNQCCKWPYMLKKNLCRYGIVPGMWLPLGWCQQGQIFRSAVMWAETVDVLSRNRRVKINSLEIEECYFEQKPDRHRPFVLKMREPLRMCVNSWSQYEIVCLCVQVQEFRRQTLHVWMRNFGACAWVQMHVYASKLVCVLIRRAFFLEKKAAHCPHAVLGIKSMAAGPESGSAWLDLSVSARWSLALFPAVCSAGPPAGTPGTQNPLSGPVGHLHRRTHPGHQPPDPLTPGLFALRPSFKKSVLFGPHLVCSPRLGSCHQCHWSAPNELIRGPAVCPVEWAGLSWAELGWMRKGLQDEGAGGQRAHRANTVGHSLSKMQREISGCLKRIRWSLFGCVCCVSPAPVASWCCSSQISVDSDSARFDFH